jgi:hypothetical protein
LSKPARIHQEKRGDFLFDDWIVKEYRRTNGFTALILLISTANLGVVPLRSTFTHMIGDELDWHQFSMLMRGAGVAWDGVLIVPVSDKDGGPIEDHRAAEELRALEDRVNENRMAVNEGHFFDNWGRRMKVEAATMN